MRSILLTNIYFWAPMLTSDLLDYSDAYFVVKVMVDLLATASDEKDKADK